VQLLKNVQAFIELECPVPSSQQPSTGPYAKPVNLLHNIWCYLSKIHLNFIYHLRLGLPSCLFLSGFLINNIHAFLFFLSVLHVLPIYHSLTWSFKLCLAKSTSYKALPTSDLLSLHLSLVQIFSSAPSSSLCSSLNVRYKVSHINLNISISYYYGRFQYSGEVCDVINWKGWRDTQFHSRPTSQIFIWRKWGTPWEN
jgi:hypothetical protein